jgi:hypothetical protein
MSASVTYWRCNKELPVADVVAKQCCGDGGAPVDPLINTARSSCEGADRGG